MAYPQNRVKIEMNCPRTMPVPGAIHFFEFLLTFAFAIFCNTVRKIQLQGTRPCAFRGRQIAAPTFTDKH